METMGEMISTLRKQKGMTQSDLAKLMNVTDKAVSKWERNQSCPDIHSLPELANILGVSVEDLLHVRTQKENKEKENLVNLILDVVPFALAIALVVTSILKSIDFYSAVGMSGIALLCLTIKNFKK